MDLVWRPLLTLLPVLLGAGLLVGASSALWPEFVTRALSWRPLWPAVAVTALLAAAALVLRLRPGFLFPPDKVWSIGAYDAAYDGERLVLAPLAGVRQPVFSARSTRNRWIRFVADPFVIGDGDQLYLFMEVLHKPLWRERGEIALATSTDAMNWHYEGVVLSEPFHLSYPHVLQWDGAYYMVPETCGARAVRLYRAAEFPCRWELVGSLLSDVDLVDATPFEHMGSWWMLATERGSSGTCRLYCAPALIGPWREHPRSPIVADDAHIARSAGRPMVIGGRLIRFAQDCVGIYGNSVRALEITKLTDDDYQEHELPDSPILSASGTGWNAHGMHQLSMLETSPERWVAFVDGKRVR